MKPDDNYRYAYAIDKPACSICNHLFIDHLKNHSTELRVHDPKVPACGSPYCNCPGYMPVPVKYFVAIK